MTRSIAEIDEELHQLAVGSANAATRHELCYQLKSLLAELWEMPGSDSRDMRCRVRTLIDGVEHSRSA